MALSDADGLESSAAKQLLVISAGRNLTALIREKETHRITAVYRLSLTEASHPNWTSHALAESYAEVAWMQQSYQQVVAGSWDGSYSIVPATLIASDATIRQELAISPAQFHEIVALDNKSSLRYETHSSFLSAAQSTFDHCRVTHPLAYLYPVWQKWAMRKVQDHTCFIHVIDDWCHVAIFHRNGSPLLLNRYSFQGEEDFLYFVMLAYKECGLNPEEHSLVLSGNITPSGTLYQLLYRYIRHISLAPWPEQLVLPAFLQGVNAHQFLDLITFQS